MLYLSLILMSWQQTSPWQHDKTCIEFALNDLWHFDDWPVLHNPVVHVASAIPNTQRHTQWMTTFCSACVNLQFPLIFKARANKGDGVLEGYPFKIYKGSIASPWRWDEENMCSSNLVLHVCHISVCTPVSWWCDFGSRVPLRGGSPQSRADSQPQQAAWHCTLCVSKCVGEKTKYYQIITMKLLLSNQFFAGACL